MNKERFFKNIHTHINNRNGKGYIIHQNPIRKKKKEAIVRSKKDLLHHRATHKVSGNIRCY